MKRVGRTLPRSCLRLAILACLESPDLLWDDAWKKGEVMLKDFRLDDEI